ncbi:uncharacterized protein [Argopecten irradians]|uniref:uncharacterized protein n=1 Tax=Argopecten irradians TaxID=31199 RepID=UPI003714319C
MCIYNLKKIPIFNLCFNVAWMVLFDRKYINISLPDACFMALTLYIIIGISSWRVRKHQDNLIKDGVGKEAWFIRFFLQNGIAFYATWVTVATHLNVAMVMHYTGGVANDISCTTALGILLFVTILWFLTETILLDAFTRYLFSPYIVLIVALSGSLAKNYDLELRYRNSILSIIILGMAILFLLLKVIILLVRHFRVPSFPKSYSPTTSEKSLRLES